MTAIVTYDTVMSSPHSNIFSIINTRSNILDPRRKNGSSDRKFVYDLDPFHKGINFGDFPYIIVQFPVKKVGNYSINGKVAWVNWVQEILVRTSYSSSANNNQGTGITDMQEICDDLEQTFNSLTIKQTLSDLNIKKVRLEMLNYEPAITRDNKTIIETTYNLTYQTRMVVSQ